MNATPRKTLTLALMIGASAAATADTLVSTGFEGLTLNPFSSATELGKGDGTDWTDALPAGWSMRYDGPIGNPVEFRGWRVMDVDSWIATEGNQDRATWTRGGVGARGSVLVEDGDAYDDGTNIDTALFNTYAQTPSVSLDGVLPGSVGISFDSFWRNEATQMGRLQVSYDGGASFETIKTYDSALLPDGQVIDEHVEMTVNNPGTGTMVFQFAYTDASNDWWWAIDNVEVTAVAVPEPSVMALGLLGLGAVLVSRRR